MREEGSGQDRSSLIAGTRIETVAQHYTETIKGLYRKPVIIGHSLGGLIAQMLAGRGLAKVTIAIEPAPFRGVLPLPAPPLRPMLRHPHDRNRAVPLSYEQFEQMFANGLDETETRALYDQFVVPAPAGPLFQAATANLNPRTEARVDTQHATRGPLLIISGDHDQMFPPAIANRCYQHQQRNHQITEIVEVPAGHSITIDHGWQTIADIAYEFTERFTTPF
jgi:non-heme chloroperoxidase